MQVFLDLSNQVYEIISRAIDLDERDRKQEALVLYRQGVQLSEQALNLVIGDSPQIRLKKQKMRDNLKSVQERIFAIQTPQTRTSTRGTTRIRSAKTPATRKALKTTQINDSNPSNVDLLLESPNVKWIDIAGLEKAKQTLWEIVVLPHLRPDLFHGLRQPCKGVLLFGPPGTGKTMLAKAVATESKASFIVVSAHSLTSKLYGETEKMVKQLFDTARRNQPCIIFMDEIDALLGARSESEHEASRRLKTEFLMQFDGLTTQTNEKLLILGATNRPQELDEAALRRFPKRVYIPLPDPETRIALIKNLLHDHKHTLSDRDLQKITALTNGYSGSDLTALAREASMVPLRELGPQLTSTPKSQVRGISASDFVVSLKTIKPSVQPSSLQLYEKWNQSMGSL
ncbi:spastin-like protein [Gorgonomyces haynaldii]|nr:spastin-like protein [Gorgonomyces haynaldii]